MTMSGLRFEKAKKEDLDLVRTFYWKLIDSSDVLGQILQWKKNLYPADADWLAYIHNEEMYLLYEGECLVGAVALTTSQSNGYKDIDWQIDVRDDAVLVTHLLAIDPLQQGRGFATSALDQIVTMAKNMGKKVVRLDAIETNRPAQCLYEKYGFKKCGWTREYYESVGLAGFYFYEFVLV